MFAPALPRAKTSYWNSCTISWVSTCSKLPRSPVSGMIMRCRLPLPELVVEHLRQPRIGALRHPRRVHGALALFRIVVHQPVLCLDDLPIEVLVLNLVLPEVLLRL